MEMKMCVRTITQNLNLTGSGPFSFPDFSDHVALMPHYLLTRFVVLFLEILVNS